MSALMNLLGMITACLIATNAVCDPVALNPYIEYANRSLEELDASERLGNEKHVKIIYEQQIKLNIASDAMNRIGFDNIRVRKLIGNTSGFNSILSDDGQNLFISSKLPHGKRLDFSALLDSGDIIDFSLFLVKSQNPHFIKLKLEKNKPYRGESEASAMMRAMRLDMIDKYYVQTIKKTIKLPHFKEIQLVQDSSYRFGDLYGSIFSFKIKNGANRDLTHDLLASSFNKIIATYVEPHDSSLSLSSNAVRRAFIVFRGSR